MLVYKVHSPYDAEGNKGLWYFCAGKYDAKKKIWFAESRYDADQSTSYGLAFYDILNGLFWQTESSKTLTRRGALGIQVGQEDIKILSGAMMTFEKDPITTYHLGIVKDVQVGGTPQEKQMLGFRAGVYSDNFSQQDKIYYSVGSGYYYKTFRIDFSIVGPNFKVEQCNYLISVSLSM